MPGHSATLPELRCESSCISRCRKGSTRPDSYRAWHALPHCKLMLGGVDKSGAPPRWYASTIGCAQNVFKWFWNGGSKLCRCLVLTCFHQVGCWKRYVFNTIRWGKVEAKCRLSTSSPYRSFFAKAWRSCWSSSSLDAWNVGCSPRLRRLKRETPHEPLQEYNPEGERCESGSPAGCSSRGMSTQNICSMWVYSWLIIITVCVFSLCVKDPCLEAIATLRCCSCASCASCASCVRLEWALEADTQFYRMDADAPMHRSRCWFEDWDLNSRSLLKLKFTLCWQAQVPRQAIWAMGWPGAWQKACTEKMTHLQRCDPFLVQFTFKLYYSILLLLFLLLCSHLPSLQS